jgi:ATP-binding cassette, subfamily B, bacterial
MVVQKLGAGDGSISETVGRHPALLENSQKSAGNEASFMGFLAKVRRRIRRFLELGEIKGPLLLIAPYVRKYWAIYAGLVVLLFGGIGITLSFTWFLQHMTDAAVKGDSSEIGRLFVVGTVLILVSGTLAYLNTILEASAVHKVRRDLKNSLFSHLMRLPSKYHGDRHSGELVSRLTNDVGGIDGAIGANIIGMLRLPLMAVAAFIYLAQINWKLALMCVLLGPVAALSAAVFGKLLRKNSHLVHEYLAQLHSFLNDSFAGHAVIRSFTLEKHRHRGYEDQNERLLALEMKLARLRGWFQVGAGAAGTVAFMLTIGLGAYFVIEGTMTVGSLLAFVNLMQYLIHPLTGIASLWGGFQRSLAALERIRDVFAEPVECAELQSPQHVSRLEKALELRDLSFSYDGKRAALEQFNLFIPAGQVIALVGPSGAGKSTLIQLIQGFYKPSAGSIVIDGVSVDQMSLSQLRSYAAFVPQETYLFSGTIRDNIAYGRVGASELDIVRAAKDANAHEFIVGLPNGYDTEIGERGVKLSGGQRQRLAIARALLKDAPILLLDEATSALDSETEAVVQEALERLMHSRTTLVIAHRLSTIHNADWIVVIDQGRIVEQGKHAELMAETGMYARLYRLQYEHAGGRKKAN